VQARNSYKVKNLPENAKGTTGLLKKRQPAIKQIAQSFFKHTNKPYLSV